MKKFLSLALLAAFAVILADPAWARMEQQQKDDGTCSWDHSTRNLNFEVPCGVHTLTVLQSAITTEKTTYVTIPLTNSRVSLIQATLTNRLTGAPTVFRFWNLDSNGNTVSEVTNGVTGLKYTTPSGSSGIVTGKVASFTPTSNHNFTQGHVLAITTANRGTNADSAVDAQFTITVRPR